MPYVPGQDSVIMNYLRLFIRTPCGPFMVPIPPSVAVGTVDSVIQRRCVDISGIHTRSPLIAVGLGRLYQKWSLGPVFGVPTSVRCAQYAFIPNGGKPLLFLRKSQVIHRPATVYVKTSLAR